MKAQLGAGFARFTRRERVRSSAAPLQAADVFDSTAMVQALLAGTGTMAVLLVACSRLGSPKQNLSIWPRDPAIAADRYNIPFSPARPPTDVHAYISRASRPDAVDC
jgi:hypothetical protein